MTRESAGTMDSGPRPFDNGNRPISIAMNHRAHGLSTFGQSCGPQQSHRILPADPPDSLELQTARLGALPGDRYLKTDNWRSRAEAERRKWQLHSRLAGSPHGSIRERSGLRGTSGVRQPLRPGWQLTW